MSDDNNISILADDFTDISAQLFQARDAFRGLEFPEFLGAPRKAVLTALTQALMHVDDAIAIAMDELGAEL